ncbi:hypothetical protein P153DRAFT_365896 [Dothidotthia symphoricarpi CBS 119687]|uniref:Uncharacterized protein n=1 Tax=Dothidotthia symphoricarpi CBS 119687 TaxID=1392245 RepID=A0A6A6AEL7_9PLEO|nr:uncharacterized protein P153DRAFT_365896 [Dothidotthia symphoricarpi CBS 119687]KAF2130260.1 hypothetical protein P153DRAFT_365896 [Dothidotthia symphoricarpi CBS 119687]
MSWWPFSGSGTEAASKPQVQQSSPAPPSIPQTAPTPTPTSSSSAPHDPDFYAAYPHLAPPSLNTTTTTSSEHGEASSPAEPYDPTLPRTMSCRAAFDSAFYCSSLGGHFNDLYRYGQLRSCTEHWNDFWFCMRTKNSYSGSDVKERLIQERYREKEEKVKSMPNSEHVWTRRGPGEEIRGAFSAEVEER